MTYHRSILQFVYMTHKKKIQVYFTRVRTNQAVHVVILPNKRRFLQMIVQHLFGGPNEKNTHINPVSAQIESDSPNQDGNEQEDCEESSEEEVSMPSGSHHFAG